MKFLTITALFALATALTQQAEAQRQGGSAHYEEPSRFPVLRKAFRQIRSDVRFHAKTIRETASDIRHDVSTTIRGDVVPEYGYRGENNYPADYNRRHQPAPVYENYYEEPPVYQPRPRQQFERRIPNRRDVEFQPEPKIVAPEPQAAPSSKIDPKQPAWMNHPRVKNPTPKIDKKTTPKPQSKPDPKPKVQATPDPKPTQKLKPEPTPQPKPDPKPEPEIVKNDPNYPVAKRSDRPGFHHSPYSPYELLDTQGIKPGELARDPGNGKIFRIPK